MVLANELLDQCEGKIEQIISSLKQDLPELELDHFATRLHQILETFQETRESLQPVHRLSNGLDVESIPELHISSQVFLQWLLKNSQGSEEGKLMEAASSNNGLELSVQQTNYEYPGGLLPSRFKQMETIWKWLNNDRVGTIGITGDHGMGKTWMVMQLKDRAITAKLFDIVIVLDMGRMETLESQQYIVDQLGLSITKKPNRTYYDMMDLNRAVALSLGKKKCLLILHHIQYEVDLSKLGFSEPLWKQNVSSKVLISGTTKVMDRIEKDRTCRVDPLNDDEAMLLLQGKTGLDIDSPHVIEIARPLVAASAPFQGLDTIVQFGGKVAELTNRVCHLLNSVKMEVIQCLQSCCYLSIESTNVKVKDLIAWWIMEILVVDCLGLEEAYEKAQHILQELIHRQFLERNETHVWLRTHRVSHLKLDSFIGIIPPPEFKKKRSCVMNENFKSKIQMSTKGQQNCC